MYSRNSLACVWKFSITFDCKVTRNFRTDHCEVLVLSHGIFRLHSYESHRLAEWRQRRKRKIKVLNDVSGVEEAVDVSVATPSLETNKSAVVTRTNDVTLFTLTAWIWIWKGGYHVMDLLGRNNFSQTDCRGDRTENKSFASLSQVVKFVCFYS